MTTKVKATLVIEIEDDGNGECGHVTVSGHSDYLPEGADDWPDDKFVAFMQAQPPHVQALHSIMTIARDAVDTELEKSEAQE